MAFAAMSSLHRLLRLSRRRAKLRQPGRPIFQPRPFADVSLGRLHGPVLGLLLQHGLLLGFLRAAKTGDGRDGAV